MNVLTPDNSYCVEMTNDLMPMALGRMFIDRYFDKNSKDKVRVC